MFRTEIAKITDLQSQEREWQQKLKVEEELLKELQAELVELKKELSWLELQHGKPTDSEDQELDKIRILGAERKRLEVDLRKSGTGPAWTEFIGSSSKNLADISIELARQASLVRGMQGLHNLDGRQFSTESWLRGRFYGQIRPKLISEIEEKGHSVRTQERTVKSTFKSLGGLRSELELSIFELGTRLADLGMARRLTQEYDGPDKKEIEVAIADWQFREFAPAEKDLVAFLERRQMGKSVSKSYLDSHLKEVGLGLTELVGLVQNLLEPMLETDAIEDFCIFLRRAEPEVFDRLVHGLR